MTKYFSGKQVLLAPVWAPILALALVAGSPDAAACVKAHPLNLAAVVQSLGDLHPEPIRPSLRACAAINPN